MAKLFIPEERQPGLSLIQRLSTSGAKEICSLLQRGLSDPLPEAQAMRSSSSFANLSQEEVDSLVGAVIELYHVRAGLDVAIEEFVRNAAEAMIAVDDRDLRVPDSERKQFERKLEVLLGAEGFSISSKANNLAGQDERSFCDARVITELRPVFEDTADASPTAMVLVHRLKIEYHVGGSEHSELYLSVDADDLKRLQQVVSRAEAEARSLESTLRDFRLFGIGGPNKE